MPRTMTFSEAIDDALGLAMQSDPSIVVFGEDVPSLRRQLLLQFGPDRVRGTPISESAFVGAAVGAAMAGLRPVVEVMMADFLAVAMDALVNHAAKLDAFTSGKWQAPLVVRAACGGGYGDGGQHSQSLWGWLAHIPGMAVVVPSTPADAGGLMLAALHHSSPVVYLEHKLLSAEWLEFLGSGGRSSVSFDVPEEGARGPVPDAWEEVPIGHAVVRREGSAVTIAACGVSVHRAMEAAQALDGEGISAAVVDLRSVAPLDGATLEASVSATGRLLVVDEDYQAFGLSGELAALLLERGVPFTYRRVCTETTIPYARPQEEQALPSVARIVAAAKALAGGPRQKRGRVKRGK